MVPFEFTPLVNFIVRYLKPYYDIKKNTTKNTYKQQQKKKYLPKFFKLKSYLKWWTYCAKRDNVYVVCVCQEVQISDIK